jgi:predicted transcriptional regulator of viral defense system
MRSIDYYILIQRELDGHFTTRQLAAAAAAPMSTARHALRRLSASGQVVEVGAGKWVDMNRVRRLALAEFVGGTTAYITAHNALYHHNMIHQVPTTIQAATTRRGKTFATLFGPIHLHHLPSALYFGWGTHTHCPGAKIATPEKALFDYFFIALSGDPAFGTLPEVEVPVGFSWSTVAEFTALIRGKAQRADVRARLDRQPRDFRHPQPGGQC